MAPVVVVLVCISIHALREEGDLCLYITIHAHGISIHALREEGDMMINSEASANGISIHALREEGDKTPGLRPGPVGDFDPRPPRGGRPRS